MNCSTRQQINIGLILTLIMALTRSHHWATLSALPDASWAIFFLVGVYLRPMWIMPALIAAAMGIDYVAISQFGVSDFCISPAYGLLVPAYASLFIAGRIYAAHHRMSLSTLPWLFGTALVGAIAAELFSSGGFYVYSGRFAEPTLAGFIPQFFEYFPVMLSSFAFYLGAAAIAHLLISSTHGQRTA
ncbi:hypothetical protein [Sulfuriferula nivalis]|uniref:Cobalamin ABC transporter n=1 Tax=Sulfuriferula nivalis TaxID=2675298 RepID=A0A809SBJ0_9PROT|nr:hypothetical protein [Sulfuriferula nivalis]BBP02342.1 hypothetical protein SFSGTM_30500 [Sulfuriferula nivalis]